MTFTQSMTKDDTALIISYSGTTAGLVDISKILVEKIIRIFQLHKLIKILYQKIVRLHLEYQARKRSYV